MSEVVQIDFSPIRGHEQANLRPAVVLSSQGFNDKTGLIVCIPCTTKIKGNPFEVVLTSLREPSAALTYHIRTLDWRDRQAFSVGFVSSAEIDEIRGKVIAVLGL
ncbi:type II toxin-antitoxin system PemK/MazF family toxin [Lysobacter antibioticus]|uniref:type II toxin-antitoxin system PemK/MazF family toxin n=1 Tax=Lysobacter antibioticus TaxID=84531 RepID=UPI0007171BC9|nr:type II toxin-antitoxin system PemK/MazF family toxin [Lysobacter antibioticus]